MTHNKLFFLTLLSTAALLAGFSANLASADPPATDHFRRTWERTDKPVADLTVSRTWMWGPQAFTGPLDEDYMDAPGSLRLVQYFDKSRMEDNSWRNASAPWDVTNGLLVVEMMTGQLQVGDNNFQQRQPAQINVGGDADDPTGPTYATMAMVRSAPPLADGQVIEWTIDRNGAIGQAPPDVANLGITAATYVPETNHRVASIFWAFMNSSGLVWQEDALVTNQLFLNPYYATGFPVTEAYWTNIKVAGTYTWVLSQCFERRCLTFNPGNQSGWQVEAGNVGQHYYSWRYGGQQPVPTPTATQPPGPAPTATATATTPPSPAPTIDETVWVSEGTSDIQVTGATWTTIPDTSLNFGTPYNSNLAVNFSAVVSAPTTEVHVRAILNGQPIEPSSVVFASGAYAGPHTFTFTVDDLQATTSLLHNLHLEWRIPAGFPGTAYMGSRTVTVRTSPDPQSTLGSVHARSASNQIQTASTGFVAIPNMEMVVNTPSNAGRIAITLSAEAWTSTPNSQLWIEALVDGISASPSQMILAQGDYTGARSCSFIIENLTSGNHAVTLRWRVDSGATAYMVSRSLVVDVAPLDPVAGGLAIRASGSAIQTTSGSFVPIPDAALDIDVPAVGPIAATLSAEASTTGGALLYVRALMDGQPMAPSEIEFAVDQFHGTQTFSFVMPQVPPGRHTVQFEWTIPGGQTAYLSSRTMTLSSWAFSE